MRRNRPKRQDPILQGLLALALLVLSAASSVRAQEDCASAVPVGNLPFTHTFDTTLLNDDLDPLYASCVNGYDEPGPDAVYVYTPAADDAIGIVLAPEAHDAALYVITDCADPYGSCIAGSDHVGDGEETIAFVGLSEGVDYYIVVDSYVWDETLGKGPYTLTIGPDFCRSPERIEPPLPTSFAGDTTDRSNAFDPAGCGGIVEARGKDMHFTYTSGPQPEIVTWTLTPLDPGMDAVLYVATDCGDIPGSCRAGADLGLEGDRERLANLVLEPDTTYHLFVDATEGGGAFLLETDAGSDPCESATPVSDLPYTDLAGDTSSGVNALSPTGCPGLYLAPAEREAVYRFSPAAAVSVDAVVDSVQPGFDPMLYVVTDCRDPSAACVAAADVWAPGFGESLVNLSVVPGMDYYFVVDAEASAGLFSFHLDEAAAPCPDPVVSVTVPSSTRGQTTGRLNCMDPVDGCTAYPFSQPGPDAVFELVAEADGVVEIACTPDAGFDPSLYVVTDRLDPEGSCVAISETSGSMAEHLSISVTAGLTYTIVVDSFWGQGGFDLSLAWAVDPCAAAMEVAGLPYARYGDTTAAEDRVNDQGMCTGYSQRGPDDLYEYTPAADENVTVEVAPEPGFDAAVYVFTDCGDVGGSCIAGADAGYSGESETIACVPLSAGTTYYVAVDSLADAGAYRIELDAIAAPPAILTLVKVPPDTVALQWTSGCQASYRVMRGPLTDFSSASEIAATSQTGYDDEGVLADGMDYFYTIE